MYDGPGHQTLPGSFLDQAVVVVVLTDPMEGGYHIALAGSGLGAHLDTTPLDHHFDQPTQNFTHAEPKYVKFSTLDPPSKKKN